MRHFNLHRRFAALPHPAGERRSISTATREEHSWTFLGNIVALDIKD